MNCNGPMDYDRLSSTCRGHTTWYVSSLILSSTRSEHLTVHIRWQPSLTILSCRTTHVSKPLVVARRYDVPPGLFASARRQAQAAGPWSTHYRFASYSFEVEVEQRVQRLTSNFHRSAQRDLQLLGWLPFHPDYPKNPKNGAQSGASRSWKILVRTARGGWYFPSLGEDIYR